MNLRKASLNMTNHLRVLLTICLMFACNTPTHAADEVPNGPNVLLIMFDDLNDWALHPPEHPKARTPNLDRLREMSVSFTNAHAVVPVCGPSRKCLFSGLYPQTLDDYGFAAWRTVPSLQGCTPLPLHFRNNGYEVYGSGKLLHEGAGGDFYTAYGIGPDYGPFRHSFEAWKDQWKEHFQPRWLNRTMRHDLSYGPFSPDSKMPDEVSAEWATRVLSKKHEGPFYLAVGIVRPHTPLHVPQKYFDLFPIEAIGLPPYLENDRDDCASVLRDRWQHGFEKFCGLLRAGGETKWREWVQAYLACGAFADEQAGKVLDTLEASPYRDNTIVVLTSDHGYHLGEKDCLQKWHLWDESTRVPLLIRVPGSPSNGETCKQPVSLIDVYPTLIDLCGLPEHPNRSGSNKPLEGHSLRPLLEDPENGRWDGPPVAFMGIRDGKEDPHFSVRSERYRYTLCANGEEELYDHDRDPHEWTNLAGDPEHAETRKKLRNEMTAILRRTTIPKGFPVGTP
jgi:arylsulfatase A-like enzyme